ncbi:hypothetical protein EJ04DRAFT_581164 [Polyplosphaeria fusca]|uniref:Uncharacterized protein n=1 Tax=Polyplosphaeria fusca TaxID=682080 RepID=A0A9P4QLG3_9PLEO|nr:hypothetical protein EJ04DRAFT_581164 [Polyplosphaeria fusca]
MEKSHGLTLLSLPAELRNEIHMYLFALTTVLFESTPPKWNTDPAKSLLPRIVNKTHAIPICVSYRQSFLDTRFLWIGLVEFRFDSVETLLNVLSSRPTKQVSEIRRMHLPESNFGFHNKGDPTTLYRYYIHDALKLLPLRLSCLTVIAKDPTLGAIKRFEPTGELQKLISDSPCWKQLRLIYPSSQILACLQNDVVRFLSTRGGDCCLGLFRNNARISRTIYRAHIGGDVGLVQDPDKRDEFELGDHGDEDVAAHLRTPEQLPKAVMLIFERRTDAEGTANALDMPENRSVPQIALQDLSWNDLGRRVIRTMPWGPDTVLYGTPDGPLPNFTPPPPGFNNT